MHLSWALCSHSPSPSHWPQIPTFKSEMLKESPLPFHFHLFAVVLTSKHTNKKFQLLHSNVNETSRIDLLGVFLYFSSLSSLKKATSGHWPKLFPAQPILVPSRNPESKGFQTKPAKKPRLLHHLDIPQQVTDFMIYTLKNKNEKLENRQKPLWPSFLLSLVKYFLI